MCSFFPHWTRIGPMWPKGWGRNCTLGISRIDQKEDLQLYIGLQNPQLRPWLSLKKSKYPEVAILKRPTGKTLKLHEERHPASPHQLDYVNGDPWYHGTKQVIPFKALTKAQIHKKKGSLNFMFVTYQWSKQNSNSIIKSTALRERNSNLQFEQTTTWINSLCLYFHIWNSY